MNLRILVCDRCRDRPQEQFRPRILPPDPVPTINPRIEHYSQDDDTQPYSGPGNLIASAYAWYGLRAYNLAYATALGKVARLRRPSDNTQIDVGVLTSGFFDWPKAWTFCSGGPCYIVTLYDQSGHNRDLTQAVPDNQPSLIFDRLYGQPVMSFGGNQFLLGVGTPTITEPLSLSCYFNITRHLATTPILFGDSGGQTAISLTSSSVPPQLKWGSSITSMTLTANNDAWHNIQAVGNDPTSYASLDGIVTNSPGTIGTGAFLSSTTIGKIVGFVVEAGLWPSAFTSPQSISMASNQTKFWGPGPNLVP